MRAPLSWLSDHVDLPKGISGREVADALIRSGFEVERVDQVGADISQVVVGEVVSIEDLTGFKKPIRYCQVRIAEGGEPEGIVCGATNFVVGDRVAVVRPGGNLPGGFTVTARETYGHTSNGMICSAKELGVGEDHSGILVLPPDTALGADVIELLGLRDEVLDIAVTPDRGYAMSIRGLAREVGIALSVPFHDRADIPVPEAGGGYPVEIDGDGCDRYVARLIEGLDSSVASPLWLQRRLALCGMRSVSLAVDITNHVMLGLGQPLHAFDADRLSGPIVVRRAQPGEVLLTLDGSSRTLDPADLVITDDSGPIALAGVMGGAATEVTPATTRILLESAHFDAVSVAKTARRHRLPSEASKRFERGVDPLLGPAAAEIAGSLFTRLAGTSTVEGVTDVGKVVSAPTIGFGLGLPARVGGRPYDEQVVISRLEQLGCSVQRGADSSELVVGVPSWRPDLRSPQDLVEEVLRLEGLETIPSVLPHVRVGRGLTRHQRWRRVFQRSVAGSGCVEVLAFPFMSLETLDAFGVSADDPRRDATRLANPLSDAEPYLRTTLLPGLLQVLTRNLGRGAVDLAIFECGLVFLDPSADVVPSPSIEHRPSDEELAALNAAIPAQPRYLAAAMTGNRERAGWWGPGRAFDWADAVELAATAAAAVGVELSTTAESMAPWHPGRCAGLVVSGAIIGYAGELHPGVLESLGLPARTCAVELDLDALVASVPHQVSSPELSSFPVATQDVALVVSTAVSAGEVETALRAGAGELLESIRLFDVYVGPQVGAGRQSLAFALRFRAPDRTLTVEEVTAARDAAVAEAGARTGAQLRT